MSAPVRLVPFPLARQAFPGLEFYRVAPGNDSIFLVTLDGRRLGAFVRSFGDPAYFASDVVSYEPRRVIHGTFPMDEAVRWILQHYVHPESKAFTSKVRSLWRMSRLDLLRVYNNANSWVVTPAPLPLLQTTEPRYFSDREEALSAANIDVLLRQLKRRFLTSAS